MDMTFVLRFVFCLIISAYAWAAPPAKPSREKEYAYSTTPAWVTPIDYDRSAAVSESPSMVTLLTDDQIRIASPYTNTGDGSSCH